MQRISSISVAIVHACNVGTSDQRCSRVRPKPRLISLSFSRPRTGVTHWSTVPCRSSVVDAYCSKLVSAPRVHVAQEGTRPDAKLGYQASALRQGL